MTNTADREGSVVVYLYNSAGTEWNAKQWTLKQFFHGNNFTAIVFYLFTLLPKECVNPGFLGE